ncbi:hypothetical protein E4U55_000274 [Claviceps digitariae]|nr:hypothetical protein E4U55_000274 [Claviceps digitariae]
MSTTSTTPPLITLYDIASQPPVQNTCFAPNPWKARLALNFKALSYQTTWVPLPEIPHLRSEILGLAPTRFFADGTPFHTLPILHDPFATSSSSSSTWSCSTTTGPGLAGSDGLLLGDSFDIAIHLDREYPLSGAGSLFPPQDLDFPFAPETEADADADADAALLIPLTDIQEYTPYTQYARFNNRIDALFTSHVALGAYTMPLDPATADLTKAEFMRRAGLSSWEDFKLVGEPRHAMITSLRDTLGRTLVGLFQRDDTGPFILGARPSYADLVVGAWLRMLQRTLPPGEWHEMKAWHGGVFGRLHDALDQWAEVK